MNKKGRCKLRKKVESFYEEIIFDDWFIDKIVWLLDRADRCDELEEKCKVLEEQVKFYSGWCDIFKENSDDHGEDCDHCVFEFRKKCLLVPKG